MRRTPLFPSFVCCSFILLLAAHVLYAYAQTTHEDSASVAATGSGQNKPARRRNKPKPVAVVQPRIDINEISAMADTNKYKITMLLAWHEMTTSSDTTDPLGMWSLAGVHGLSWTYNGQRPISNAGFCRHSSSDFGPWHRPYMLQFEKGLQQAAKRAVVRITDRKLRNQYLRVVKQIRLPYWDWTNPSTPRILTDPTVQIIDRSGRMIPVSNPFLSYRYQQYIGGGRGSVTTRGYNWAAAMSSSASSFATQMRSLVASRSWPCTYDGYSSRSCPGNLELTHDNVHNILGGTNGEMATVPYAGFDPLFWLHHAMIDRVLWLFQNNGGGWQGSSVYTPFLNLQGNLAELQGLNYTYRDPLAGADLGGGWTFRLYGSNNTDNNHNDRWGNSEWGRHRRMLLQANPHALPSELEVPDSGTQIGSPAAVAAVKRQLQSWSRGYQGYTWNVEFRNLMKNVPESSEAVNIHVFLKRCTATSSRSCPDFPTGQKLDANQLRLRPDYCGSIAGFREVMREVRDKPHVASVDLTHCLQSAGVNVGVPPQQVNNDASGPTSRVVRVSQLRLLALTASGLDVTEQYSFGEPVINWALPIASPPTGSVATAGATSSTGGSDSSYTLLQGSFD